MSHGLEHQQLTLISLHVEEMECEQILAGYGKFQLPSLITINCCIPVRRSHRRDVYIGYPYYTCIDENVVLHIWVSSHSTKHWILFICSCKPTRFGTQARRAALLLSVGCLDRKFENSPAAEPPSQNCDECDVSRLTDWGRLTRFTL